jgi:hypothetical protein
VGELTRYRALTSSSNNNSKLLADLPRETYNKARLYFKGITFTVSNNISELDSLSGEKELHEDHLFKRLLTSVPRYIIQFTLCSLLITVTLNLKKKIDWDM